MAAENRFCGSFVVDNEERTELNRCIENESIVYLGNFFDREAQELRGDTVPLRQIFLVIFGIAYKQLDAAHHHQRRELVLLLLHDAVDDPSRAEGQDDESVVAAKATSRS